MTTRCTVKITDIEGHSIYLDRFTDGSLAHAGADVYLAATLAHNAFNPDGPDNPPHVIATNHLLSQISPANSFRSAEPLYHLVGRPDLDTEHFYHIDCHDGYTFLNYGDGYMGCDLENRTQPFALCQFRDLINTERHAANRALIALAARDDYYAQHSPFPDLA